jgi:hypothetical protein
MEQDGHKPDVYAYNALMEAYRWSSIDKYEFSISSYNIFSDVPICDSTYSNIYYLCFQVWLLGRLQSANYW